MRVVRFLLFQSFCQISFIIIYVVHVHFVYICWSFVHVCLCWFSFHVRCALILFWFVIISVDDATTPPTQGPPPLSLLLFYCFVCDCVIFIFVVVFIVCGFCIEFPIILSINNITYVHEPSHTYIQYSLSISLDTVFIRWIHHDIVDTIVKWFSRGPIENTQFTVSQYHLILVSGSTLWLSESSVIFRIFPDVPHPPSLWNFISVKIPTVSSLLSPSYWSINFTIKHTHTTVPVIRICTYAYYVILCLNVWMNIIFVCFLILLMSFVLSF